MKTQWDGNSNSEYYPDLTFFVNYKEQFNMWGLIIQTKIVIPVISLLCIINHFIIMQCFLIYWQVEVGKMYSQSSGNQCFIGSKLVLLSTTFLDAIKKLFKP